MTEPFRKALQRGPECPATETLIGDPGGFEAHLRSCSFCQTELALYNGFEAGEIRSDERDAVEFIVGRLQRPTKETVTAVPFWRRFFTPVWMGGVAVAIAAVLFAVGLTSQSRLRQSTEASEDRTLRSHAVTFTSPTGDVAEVPRIIQWQPVDGAGDYNVTLKEIDGTLIFHRNVTTSQVLLSEDTRRLLKPGKKVLLEVEARDVAGMEIARSGAVSVRLETEAQPSH